MNALAKQCIATAFAFIVCAQLSGCLISEVNGGLGVSQTPPEYVATLTAQVQVGQCTRMVVDVTDCIYETELSGQTYTYDTSGFFDPDPLQAIFDPLILNLPAKAHNISGTFDNGQGFSGPLVITTGLTSLPIDANTTLAAPAGYQFVIVDLPPNPPIGNYTFSFTFTAFPPAVYAAFAAKVQVGGKTYYPLLFPCSTDVLNKWWHGDFASPGLPPGPLFTPQNLAGLATCNNKVYTFPTTTTPDLNQHGLTGSWYEAATTGQGAEVEVFPNLSAPGTGLTQISWFTYDTAAGGADHQRWYTLSGPVMTGQPNAALTIYQNTDGNFNALPVTMAHAVGTATLSFATCTSGQLAYNFTDGTGRTGNIPLTRLTQNVTCSTTTPFPTNADFALSGNWFDSATAGQGFTVEVNPNSGAFFSAWYTYAPMGAAAGAAGQRWSTAQNTAAFTPGMRSIPVTIYETTEGIFNMPPPPAQMTVPVGTGTMAFQSCTAATFSYNFTSGPSMGLSGTINLSRVGPVPPGCTS